MKNPSVKIGFALYAVALLAIFSHQVVPLLTGKPWNPATLYVLHSVAVAAIVVASCTFAAHMYQMFKRRGVRSRSWPEGGYPVQSHILRYAEDIYRQQGYFNQGSFFALNIALQYSVDEKDPLIEDAMLALVEAGKLVPHRSDKGTVYALRAARQMEMIQEHDLARKWQERGADFLPNDPLVGEIRRVKSAVANQQRQQVNT